MKDIYSYEKKYYENMIDNENDFRMSYNTNCISYHLTDFIMYDIEDGDNYEDLYDNYEECCESNDTETLKILLYKATNRKIFFGKLEKYNDITIF